MCRIRTNIGKFTYLHVIPMSESERIKGIRLYKICKCTMIYVIARM
jgi:hypothetical protein